jgi:hypothetical protein
MNFYIENTGRYIFEVLLELVFLKILKRFHEIRLLKGFDLIVYQY